MTTDQTTTDTNDQGTQPSTGDDPAGLRKLVNERGTRISELEAELASYKRNEVFDAAGIPKDGPATYFRKAYDGDLTPDAIKAAAEQGGIITPPPPPPPDTPVEEQQAHRDADAVTNTPPPAAAGLREQMAKAAAAGPQELARFMESQGLVND